MQAFVFCARRNKRRNKNAVPRVIITSREMVMSWIDAALNFLDQGRVGFLGGTVVAIVAYLKARQRTSLGYVYFGEHLLGSASDALPPGIVVQYDGITVPRLTKSIIIIWNNGENTVSGTDIVGKDPLRFHVGTDGRILSTSVLKVSREVNEFHVLTKPDEETNEAVFTFGFLDAKDGAVVEILHTSTDRNPSPKGTLRGLPQGFRNLGQFTRPKPQKKKSGKLSSIVSNLLPVATLFGGFLFAVYGPRPSFLANPDTGIFFYSFGGAFVGMWINTKFWTRRRYPKSLHIEALE